VLDPPEVRSPGLNSCPPASDPDMFLPSDHGCQQLAMESAAQRVSAIEDAFRRCRGEWRAFFFELDSGDDSLSAEEPFQGLDEFLNEQTAESREQFRQVLAEMIESGDLEEKAQALSIIGSCSEAFDLEVALRCEEQIAADLEAHVALLLAIGQRRFAEGREVVLRALSQPTRKHAALIALAQLDPEQAGKLGREAYTADRHRILSVLARPLGENEYATFYEMAKSTLQVLGKDGLNMLLRTVAGDDPDWQHELAQLARRLIRQQQDERERA